MFEHSDLTDLTDLRGFVDGFDAIVRRLFEKQRNSSHMAKFLCQSSSRYSCLQYGVVD